MAKASKSKKADEIRVDKRKETNRRSSRETCLPYTSLPSDNSYTYSPQPYPRGPSYSPDMIYLAKQGFLGGPSPPLHRPPQCSSAWNGPFGSPPYSNSLPIQNNGCRNTLMEREIRKCIDEYNTVYKQINELITKKTIMRADDKKLSNARQTSTKPSASGGVTFSAATAAGIVDETRATGIRYQTSSKKRGNESAMNKRRRSSHRSNNENRAQKKGKKERDVKKEKNIRSSRHCCQLIHKGNAKRTSMEQESPYYYELKSMEPVNKQSSVKPSWGVWNQKLQKTMKKICERTKGGDGERCCTCDTAELATSFCSRY